MRAPRKTAAIDLYQADLDRHAFAFEPRRHSERQSALGVIWVWLHQRSGRRARWQTAPAISSFLYELANRTARRSA